MSWIQTFTGRKFDLLRPEPGMVELEDIAHALARLCRFAGHCREFYSVAQHSVLVASAVPRAWRLQALLHDATEAYCVDVPSPLKRLLPEYAAIEGRVWAAIAERFGVPEELAPEVKEADRRALLTEKRDLLGPSPEEWVETGEPFPVRIIDCQEPEWAEGLFRATYADLVRAHEAELRLEARRVLRGVAR